VRNKYKQTCKDKESEDRGTERIELKKGISNSSILFLYPLSCSVWFRRARAYASCYWATRGYTPGR